MGELTNTPGGTWYLECFPSEIPVVYEKLTGKPAPPMPAWVPETPGGSPRPAEQVLLFASMDEGCPAAVWDAFYNAGKVRQATRIIRRQPQGATSIGVTSDNTWVCSIEVLESGTWLMTFFAGIPAFSAWLSGVSGILEVPAMQISAFRKAPAAMISVIGGLCDLFNERFPHPDPDWAPAGNPEFSADMLEEYFRHPERSSWYRRLQELVPELPPDPGMEQLDILLQVLRNENLIGESEEGEGTWYMGTGLLWAIRMLSWWDLGLVMPGHASGFSILIQASCPWIFSRNADGTYTLEAQHGPAVIRHITAWLETPDSGVPRTPPPPPTAKKQVVPPPPPGKMPACPACHSPVHPAAKYCPQCGIKLKN